MMTNDGRITYEDLVAWNACDREPGKRHSREALDAWLGADWSLSLIEVLSLESVPAVDRVWVACQPCVLTEEQATAWLDVVVTRAVRTHALTCVVLEVKQWAARWLSGEDRSAAAARAAARAAAAARASLAEWAEWAEWAASAAAAAWAEWAAAAAWAEWERAAEWAAAAAWAEWERAAAAAWAEWERAAAAETWEAAAWAAWAEERERQVRDLIGVLLSDGAASEDQCP